MRRHYADSHNSHFRRSNNSSVSGYHFSGDVFSNIDINSLAKNLEDKLQPIELKLIQYRLLSKDQKIITLITDQVFSFIRMVNFPQIINKVLSMTGNIFVGTFAVLFTSFFLLKDKHLAYNFILLVTPLKYHHEMENILASSKRLLSRYFIGLCLELILITSCYAVTLSLFGIKDALLIAFIGGILHVIPYLGPLIGGTLGVSLELHPLWLQLQMLMLHR